MKINNISMSFGADLLINNMANKRGIKKSEQTLKDNFAVMTPNSNNIMILTTIANSNEDRFELYDENGESIAKYSIPLTKYIKSTPVEKISKRLADIYEVMKIKASFNYVIKMLKNYRAKCNKEIEQIERNDSLDPKAKSELIRAKKNVVKGLDRQIEYNARSSEIECDSYEILHGMKSEFD